MKKLINHRQHLFVMSAVSIVAGICMAMCHGAVSADSAYTFSGTLTDGSGHELPGVQISLRATDGSSGSAVTDSNGDYSIIVPPDTYALTINSYGNNPIGTIKGASALLIRQTSPSINLTSGDVTQDLQLLISTLHVTVEDSDGNPVSGAAVSATAQNSGGTTHLYPGDPGESLLNVVNNQPVTTSVNGEADITSVVGTIYGAGNTGGSKYDYICANVAGGNVCLSVPLSVTGDTNIVLQQPPITHTFSGTLTDSEGNPLSHVQINLSAADGNNGSTLTDSAGNYSFTLAPDTYAISMNSYGNYAIGTINGANALLIKQNTPGVNVTTGDVTQDLQLQTAVMHVTVEDADGDPIPNASVSATAQNSGGTTHLYPGDPGESLLNVVDSTFITTDDNGNADITTIVGTIYGAGSAGSSKYDHICATISGEAVCLTAPLAITGDTSIVLSPAPATPTNLTATSPAKTPALSWDAVSGASSYNIYRDGTKIGTSSTTAYTDATATDGTHSYYVTAVNDGGESDQSNTVTVLVDKTRPTASFTSPSSFDGPFPIGPTVSIEAYDGGSGLHVMAIHVYTSSNQLLTTCGSATPTELAAGSMSCDLSSLPAGTYHIKAGTTDEAGNNRTIVSGDFVIGE